jgi:4-amino-4-deoxy-L-arabinose transferase-like glycosyltransferase
MSNMKVYKSIVSANSTAIAFFSLFSMCLVLFAYIAHPIEEINNAERDGYVKLTEQLSNGEIPRDAYRPLLYPVLSAFLRLITNDSFRAAQLVSVISAIATAWILYFFARKFLSDVAAFFCASMLVLNFTFIHNAVLATTDMLFTALCLCALFFAHSYFRRPRVSVLLAIAFFFSMAFFTRYTAIYLLFPIAVSIFFATPNSIKLIVRATATAGAAAIIFLLPHFVLSYDQFGSIMYTENLRNVAWKIGQHSYYAWPHYSQLPYDEIMEIVSSQWMQVLRIGAKSTIENFFGISGLLAPSHLFQSILYFGFIGGFGIAVVRGRWDIVLIFAVVISYISMIGFTFFPYPRIMLPILPLMYI